MGYLYADLKFETDEFDQAVRYVLNSGITEAELFAEFDPNIKYEEDPLKWDEDYYAYACVCLKDNFSEKRIQHVKNIASKLYPNAAKKRNQESKIMKVSPKAPTANQTGGSKLTGKKTQDQQQSRKNATILKQANAKIIGIFIGIVVFVLLVFLIVFIMNKKEKPMETQSVAASENLPL